MSEAQQITIPYEHCESKLVSEWGYHADSKTLGVKFRSGGEYWYFDVPQCVADAMRQAESIGKFVGSSVRAHFRYERQPDEPGGVVFGLPQKQEPKYTTSRIDGRIVNRSTAKPIPDFEPVIVFRGQDRKLLPFLRAYAAACDNPDHRAVVKSRIQDFEAFAAEYPHLMKEPDSSLQDLTQASIGRAPFTPVPDPQD
jgi:hypothetical protein